MFTWLDDDRTNPVRDLDGELPLTKDTTTRSPWPAAGGGTSKPSRLALGAYQPMRTGPRETSLDGAGSKFEALGALLNSDRIRPGCMSLSEIDGFLAALALGPGLIPAPEDWMPAIWGEGEPAFADLDEAWQAVDALMSRGAEVYRQLRDNPDAYRPVFRIADDDAEIAADWDKKVPGARSSKALVEVRRQARTTIPSAVVDLCRFWQERDGDDCRGAGGHG